MEESQTIGKEELKILYEIYKAYEEADREYFNKKSSLFELVKKTIKKEKGINLEDILDTLIECKAGLKENFSNQNISTNSSIYEFLALLEKNIQLLFSLITVLKEAKKDKKTVPFSEYMMMVNYYRSFKERLSSQVNVIFRDLLYNESDENNLGQ